MFDLGGITLKIYETPGHTQGGISVLYLEKNILFVGDATGMFVWLFAKETTDLTTYVEAVQKMYDLNAVSYIGAHNPNPMKKDNCCVISVQPKRRIMMQGNHLKAFSERNMSQESVHWII